MKLVLTDIVFFVLLFIVLSSPFMYKITNKLTFNMLNTTSKGLPNCLGVGIHALIFFIVIYFYFKNKENFDVCPPGYQQTKANTSIFEPNRSWCEMGNKNLEDSDDDDDNSNDNKDKEADVCESGYTSTKEDSYFTDRKSWCRKNQP